MRTPASTPEPVWSMIVPRTPRIVHDEDPLADSAVAGGKSLATEILELFFFGAVSFWRWVPAQNTLTTHGSLNADTLEDWIMRIHPRDQGEFSRFIDQTWQQGEPSVFVEYRFNPNRQGEWLHVRHTASCSGSGDRLAVSCLIENLPPSKWKESPLERMAEAFRVGEATLSTGSLKREDRIDDGDTSTRLSLRSGPTDGLMRRAQRAYARQEPNEGSQINRQPSRPPRKSASSISAHESPGMVAAPPSDRQDRASLMDAQLEGTTILLVEDEAAVRKLVRRLLEMLGCNVIEAVSGREALDLWPSIRDQVTLLVSDVVMPDGVSGWDLARELHQRHPALGILLTSGYDKFPEDHSLQGLPQIAFLQKPYEVQRLKKTLSDLMQLKLGFGQTGD